jgi:hypothetical protein
MFARWAYSPATKKRQRDDEFASQAFVLALLIGGVAVVFWQQLVGAVVFIGETDRLNTYLNMRLAEYDALRTYGRMPAWNPTMFGGFSVAALHWMNPGTDPIAFFLQLFPRAQVYQALGYVSIALVLAAWPRRTSIFAISPAREYRPQLPRSATAYRHSGYTASHKSITHISLSSCSRRGCSPSAEYNRPTWSGHLSD